MKLGYISDLILLSQIVSKCTKLNLRC